MKLVFFLEERSAKKMLEGFLPHLLPKESQFPYRCICFDGKQNLLKNLESRLKGWNEPKTRFIVLIDGDNQDCHALKKQVCTICKNARKPDALIRIVCQELESWYLGDLKSVGRVLGMPELGNKQTSQFQSPDSIQKPKEKLKSLTKNQYQPVGNSYEIGRALSINGNCSKSFEIFVSGLLHLVKNTH